MGKQWQTLTKSDKIDINYSQKGKKAHKKVDNNFSQSLISQQTVLKNKSRKKISKEEEEEEENRS
jgi:hypothetical protein